MKKYGLILTGKHATKQPASKPPMPRTISAFGGDDSDDEDGLQARMQSERNRQYQESATSIAAVSAPELSDYDSFLEKKQATEAAAKEQAKASRKQSKYIGALKRNADRRSFQLEQMRERQIQREQEAEKDEFGETERFVTGAYKAKLAADKVRAEVEARLEAEDKARAKAGMAGFYANLGKAAGLGGKHSGQELKLPPRAPAGHTGAPSALPSSGSASRGQVASTPSYNEGRYEAGHSRIAAPVSSGSAGASPGAEAPSVQSAPAMGGYDDDFEDFDDGEVLLPGQFVTPPVASAVAVSGRSRSRSPPAGRSAEPTSRATGDGQDVVAAPALAPGAPVSLGAIQAAKARAIARAAQRSGATG
jgi:hypothetical protein